MRNAINLFEPKSWSLELKEILQNKERHLIRENIMTYLVDKYIIGFHYTRANPESIKEKGLLLRTGEEIRSEFLKEYSNIFDEKELKFIKKSFSEFAPRSKMEVRDNNIFFTSSKMINPFIEGTKDLINLYGGEQIYFSISENYPSIVKKISSLGKPLMVKCKLKIDEICASYFIENYIVDCVTKTNCIENEFHQSHHVSPENLEVYKISQNNDVIAYTKL